MCVNATVTNSSWVRPVYRESLSCTLPAGTPANVYTAWICQPGACVHVMHAFTAHGGVTTTACCYRPSFPVTAAPPE